VFIDSHKDSGRPWSLVSEILLLRSPDGSSDLAGNSCFDFGGGSKRGIQGAGERNGELICTNNRGSSPIPLGMSSSLPKLPAEIFLIGLRESVGILTSASLYRSGDDISVRRPAMKTHGVELIARNTLHQHWRVASLRRRESRFPFAIPVTRPFYVTTLSRRCLRRGVRLSSPSSHCVPRVVRG